MRDKVLDVVKVFIERVIPNHAKALEDHEEKDNDRFSDVKETLRDVKGLIGDAKGEILQAMNQNIGYIREDMKTEKEATAKRVEFLEKVFLDSRLQ